MVPEQGAPAGGGGAPGLGGPEEIWTFPAPEEIWTLWDARGGAAVGHRRCHRKLTVQSIFVGPDWNTFELYNKLVVGPDWNTLADFLSVPSSVVML